MEDDDYGDDEYLDYTEDADLPDLLALPRRYIATQLNSEIHTYTNPVSNKRPPFYFLNNSVKN